MREIKFRVWDDGKMRHFGWGCAEFYKMHMYGFEAVDDLIWMQYTGLKDKAGVEIYEGDLVKMWGGDESEEVCEVKHGEYSTNGFEYNGYWGFYLKGKFHEDCLFVHDEPEVVGNIYESKVEESEVSGPIYV